MDAVNTPNSPARLTALTETIDGGLNWLDNNQAREGFWVGILESNACIEAQWLLAMHFLGIRNDPKKEGLVQGLLNTQRPDGSWEIYFDAPQGDINATVESYAALRASGLHPEDVALRRARGWIFAHGGLAGTGIGGNA